MTRNRAMGVTYTNTTNRPIYISVSGSQPGGGYYGSYFLYVNGLLVSKAYSTNNTTDPSSLSGIIPAGGSYYATGPLIAYIWAELR